MKKSDNPLLAEIQDLILEKYDLESWPSSVASGVKGNWIDIHLFDVDTPTIFTMGIVDSEIIIYKLGSSRGYDNTISLYDGRFLDKVWEFVEDVISSLNIPE